jgi:diguanylate cyclase (GGDEF)-like protein/PAS domain S-box-containing protein
MAKVIATDGDALKSDVFTTGVFVRPSSILLVSQVPADHAAIERLLAVDNHSVELAPDVLSALKSIPECKPDLILIDASLPEDSAFNLCHHLKTAPDTTHIPVVLLFDPNTSEKQVNALDSGANDVVRKPLDGLVFRARVRSLLKYKRAVAELRAARKDLEARVKERTAQLQTEIQGHKRTEVALKESQERFALAAQGANDGLWDWDLRTNKIYFSARWKFMLGYSESTTIETIDEWFALVHVQELEEFKTALTDHFEGRTQHLSVECRVRHKDGTERWMLVRGMAVRDANGVSYRIAGSQSDITSRKVMELQLRHDAFYDGLTGLPNRALFLDRLNQAMGMMRRDEKRQYAILLLDIDKFKLVNDSLGHIIGDHLLIEFARRLRRCPQESDTVARLGGDEFVILMQDVDGMEGAKTLARRIHEEFKTPLLVHGREMYVTTSIGLALGKTRYERSDDVLRDADTALYQAKAAGRGRHEAFSSGMHMQVLSLLDLEHDLRIAAKDCSQFTLHYQPILELQGPKLIGFEALLRWNHPDRGNISPIQFIPVAEETELITPITYWVLQTACKQLNAWMKHAKRTLPLYISVNLSGKTLTDPDLPVQIEKILRAAEVPPQQIKLEITEGSLMKNPELALATLSTLKKMNLGLMVDDFGTGYSSLSYLHRLPLDVLKIDRSFIQDVPMEKRNIEIVKTISILAERLGLQTVAEGVETKEQHQWLKSIHCRQGQGYLFAKPLPAEEALAFLTANS